MSLPALLIAASLFAEVPRVDMPLVLPERRRAELRDAWLGARLRTIVPALMRENGVDAWVLIAREYNEDPVVKTMLPATWLNARRTTILLFLDHGPDEGVERLAVARYAVGEHFEGAWDKDLEPDQWARLSELLTAHDPGKIAINVSPTFALADGLSASLHETLERALPEPLRARIVSGENLAIGWLETRIPAELEVYPSLCRLAHEIIAEGLSNRAVQPGETTTRDLEWWFRERLRDLRLDTWFHPSVSLQRAQSVEASGSFADEPANMTIRRGDLLHVDFGLTYLGLNTDTQQHAYVLRAGEKSAPRGLTAGLRVGNRLQDLLTEAFVTGRSGNAILAATRARAEQEGIDALIYTHPLGLHGHAAGPTIGMWDQQGGVPGSGDYSLRPSTVFSIELSAGADVEEWGGQRVRFMLEEDAYFDGTTVRYLDGRQTELILIP